jgi:pyruvate/2-oxoglutarate dehydrogenase complex dihydrolipoamide acyltransferase (E2) component
MAIVEIKIPQLGEGLQEARIVRFIKQPGESVAQDEPIYEMETDKAVMEIESPAAGILAEWEAKEDDVLPIGAVIGRLTTDGANASAGEGESGKTGESTQNPTPNADRPTPNTERPTPNSESPTPNVDKDLLRTANIPPRTRAYAKVVQLTEDELSELIRSNPAKLMPDDIDRFLASRGKAGAVAPDDGRLTIGDDQKVDYTDIPLPPRHKTLVYRLQQATRDVVPATMEMRVEWSGIEATRTKLKENAKGPQPSQFLIFAWCVAHASKSHPRFRSALHGDAGLRQYKHLNLGIAVAREGDELLLARVDAADALSFPAFVSSAQAAIQRARDGVDQASDTMQLSLTNMAAQGVRMGIPVIAAPAAGTLFVGEPFDEAYPLPSGEIGFRRMVSMVLSFDHRIANGVGAANFLGEIKKLVQEIEAASLADNRRE